MSRDCVVSASRKDAFGAQHNLLSQAHFWVGTWMSHVNERNSGSTMLMTFEPTVTVEMAEVNLHRHHTVKQDNQRMVLENAREQQTYR